MTLFGVVTALLVFGVGFFTVAGLLLAAEAYWKEWAE